MLSTTTHRTATAFVCHAQKRIAVTKTITTRRYHRLHAATAEMPVATDFGAPAPDATPAAVRKYLLSAGWDIAWIDGVTTEMRKKNISTSVSQCEAVINYLTSLGLTTLEVENMVSLSKPILARGVDQLSPVVEWIKSQGLSGTDLAEFLKAYPTLLTYDPSGDGKNCLAKGKARAALEFGERGGRKVAGVINWREGAAFGTSPIAPTAPQV